MLYDDNLKYRYEQQFLAKHPIKKRMQQPYASFRTTNFMVRRDLLLAYPFDETFHEYGYEDTLFGKQLKEHGATLIHLDNAATIADYEDNSPRFAEFNKAIAEIPVGVALLRTLIDQHKLSYSDLKDEIGSKSLVSQILSGQRSLTITHIKALSARFGVKPEWFL